VTAFGIPEEHPEHWKVDGWRMALEQCATVHQVVEIECKLYASLKFATARRIPMPHGPQLLRMCAERWDEIAAESGDPGTRRRQSVATMKD
jgi:hypothetical protein